MSHSIPARRIAWYPDEEWADVPGFEGTYWISSYGRVKSRPRGSHPGKILTPYRRGKGPFLQRYAAVALCLSPAPRIEAKLHTLVMRAFVGPCPPGLEICHNDSDPMNPRADNLRYDSHLSNVLDTKLRRIKKPRIPRRRYLNVPRHGLPPGDPRHGTRTGYSYWRCRCPACVIAESIWKHGRRAAGLST